MIVILSSICFFSYWFWLMHLSSSSWCPRITLDLSAITFSRVRKRRSPSSFSSFSFWMNWCIAANWLSGASRFGSGWTYPVPLPFRSRSYSRWYSSYVMSSAPGLLPSWPEALPPLGLNYWDPNCLFDLSIFKIWNNLIYTIGYDI